MTVTTLNKVYQHRASALNLAAGTHYHGCFRTKEEAERFIKKAKLNGAIEASISSGLGSMPYGEWEDHFDIDTYFDRLGEWLGGYTGSGRD